MSDEPKKIMLKGVRLSFPNIYQAKAFNEGQDAKFSATALIDKDEQADVIKKVKAEIKACAEEKWGKGKVPKGIKVCLQDGDEKAYDGYSNCMYIAASNKIRPTVVDRDRSPLTAEDDRPYAGCYVNMTISLWAQDNQYGKRINANLRGIQFVKDGERFGAAPVNAEDEFDFLDDVEESDAEAYGDDDDGMFD